VSHSQDFLNGVCTHIIWLTRQTLTYYSGNYDTFRKTVGGWVDRRFDRHLTGV
jgi:ATP-binding cassette subfamily F protein 2